MDCSGRRNSTKEDACCSTHSAKGCHQQVNVCSVPYFIIGYLNCCSRSVNAIQMGQAAQALQIANRIYCTKTTTIHQVTTTLATSENVLFPGHSHLLTTSIDDLTLELSPE